MNHQTNVLEGGCLSVEGTEEVDVVDRGNFDEVLSTTPVQGITYL